ncbi:GDSL-like Lipase/Acylhydrolase [Aquisphaera giovannonii]|uniref:GDSL-like Lipase/Acylhydrolase n=1 Tax=Aquisphaera giovannonii TaxID=406548 RepID=A0A5B9WDC2_9BACT|nr:SGNH/GDSL hydrolase family protein [Aquisphaera giovannonii]QEH38582.1 GDSL-like Lipase/Acylhydrolase [Aquisphaera giovannonii]
MNVFRNTTRLATLALALVAAAPARAGDVYLSLGDSLAFGYDPSAPNYLTPSYGDQGFVGHFADVLAAVNGGVRPAVLNLGVVGEQSTSFFDPTALSPTGPPRAWQLNKNYDGTGGALSQNDLMLSSIASLHAAGDHIGAVTLIFGANDIFALLGSDAFKNADPAAQAMLIGQTITAALTNYGTVLTELKTVAPEARVFLPGYFNPFPAAIDPTDHALYDEVLGFFNPNLKALADNLGATYVDTYAPFVGHELEYTNIASGDFHPNAAGYAVIGSRLGAAAVPEPSGLISLATAIGAGAVAAAARRRASARRPAA